MIDLQHKVVSVGREVFGDASVSSPEERLTRFGEEALETLQAGGMSLERVIELATFIYSLPVGELPQEIAGAGNTLIALADVHDINFEAVVEKEVSRVYANKAKIRAKAAAKPDHLFVVRPLAA